MKYVCYYVLLIFMKCCDLCTSTNNNIPLFPLSRGLHIPQLGLGTAGLRQSTSDIVLFALQSGIKLIDTAQAPEWYSEEGVGDGIKRYLDEDNNRNINDLIIVTKIHPRSFEVNKLKERLLLSNKYINNDMKNTLDVVLLHSPWCWTGHCSKEEERYTWKEAWNNLEKIKLDGEVLAIGVSNFDAKLLQQLLDITNTKVSIIQNWMDPFHQDKEVRTLCEKNNIIYMAYSSQGTQWEGKLRYNPLHRSSLLINIAAKHNVTIYQVVQSWVLQENVISIPRSSKTDHVTSNSIYSIFLDDEDMRKIRSLDGTIGNPWD